MLCKKVLNFFRVLFLRELHKFGLLVLDWLVVERDLVLLNSLKINKILQIEVVGMLLLVEVTKSIWCTQTIGRSVAISVVGRSSKH